MRYKSVIMCPIFYSFLFCVTSFISYPMALPMLCCAGAVLWLCVVLLAACRCCAFIGFTFNLIGFGFRFQYDWMNDFAWNILLCLFSSCFAFGSKWVARAERCSIYINFSRVQRWQVLPDSIQFHLMDLFHC